MDVSITKYEHSIYSVTISYQPNNMAYNV